MLKSKIVHGVLLTGIIATCIFLVSCPQPTASGPAADFRADVTSGAAPLTVHFTDLSVPGASSITQWAWVFGDNGTSAEQDPTHTYAAAGRYNVSLMVTTAKGEDTKLKLNFVSVTAAGEGEGEGEGEGQIQPGEMVSVPEGTFIMGNSGVGDDAAYSYSDELPAHSVHLTAYEIGKYDVTNQEYADILNWALGKGYLKDSKGAAYAGLDVYAAGQALLYMTYPNCNIQYSGSAFSPVTRTGLPGTTQYSMASHPVIDVTWYGAAMYCNWLSEKEGLSACYNTANWNFDVSADGYHLPTEAQWERAAAWDAAASKHWIYGFMSDTLTGKNRCNYYDGNPNEVNPLGLTDGVPTSPVGWFNGANISPNGNVQTVDSPSPLGCYDMSGNVWQWCNDWWDTGYYQTCQTQGTVTDAQGLAMGSYRVIRGGSWDFYFYYSRSAFRSSTAPTYTGGNIGFRLVRS